MFQDVLEGTHSEDVLVQIYKCGVCSETFSELHDLQEHVVKHKKDLTCTTCKKAFPTKVRLEVWRLFSSCKERGPLNGIVNTV